MSKKSFILVSVQFAIFAFFIFSGRIFAMNYWFLIQVLGFIISTWGILAMKIGNFNVQPEVKPKALFITSGPYKFIRNPMYAGLILFFGASVISYYSPIRLAVLILLIYVFIEKIKLEEQFLLIKFDVKYSNYKKKTYRLIPFIY
ncbi:MAG: isoprenylcysteine carboxylmethyltransferase family protein [Flavobacteriaceae bacterium]|nr:isoprenylcysteine carboxylmethyltransferase family protein [Flavobacteriaceae bacterium]